jgi:hypothetical protein
MKKIILMTATICLFSVPLFGMNDTDFAKERNENLAKIETEKKIVSFCGSH